MRNITQSVNLSLIGLLLLGYVLADRGFAHLGWHPVYVGEVVLAISLSLFLIYPEIRVFLHSRILWLLAALIAWCIAQTVPYIDEYGTDALQDSALYAYSAFTFTVSAAMINVNYIENFCRLYNKAITFSVIIMPVLLILTPTDTIYHDDIPLIVLKSGDTAVHLAGAAAFRLINLQHAALATPARRQRLVSALFWLSWTASALWTASTSRGAMLAMAGAIIVIMAFGFARRQVFQFLAALALILMILGLFSVRLEQGRRDISVMQIVENASSIFDDYEQDSSAGDLGATTRWRLKWWNEILDYVVFGDDFWTGRGFGINLANADRFQADPDGRLRSPHNGHLTFLARAGVPGFVLWLAFLAAFGIALVRKARQAFRQHLANWQRLYVWVLSYWVASLINATFDVYLEGPQGGIWFWSIIGFGVAALMAGPSEENRRNLTT